MKQIVQLLILISLGFSQTLPKADPVLQNIWDEVQNNSQVETLAHELLDGIGPRLVGTPAFDKAGDWAIEKMKSWGIKNARKENYGTWRGWERGISHIDMISPWVRSLSGMSLAWSPSTNGKAVQGKTVTMPMFKNEADYKSWLKTVKGKFVLMSPAPITGRPDDNWEEFGVKEDIEAMKALRDSLQKAYYANLAKTGIKGWRNLRTELPKQIEEAGALGLVSMYWSKGWGVSKVFSSSTEKIPTVGLNLEDYGMLHRLTESGKAPTIRVRVDSKFTKDVPTFNVIGEIRGVEKPDEYVILSAHLDSWDGATGATDNGTGSVVMLESIRLLKKFYPNPKRTILIGLWEGEEQGLNGSRAFVKDNPKIVEGVQAVFNQDNGTGRVVSVKATGFLNAASFGGQWLSEVPVEVTKHINKFEFPGSPIGGGSDYISFMAAGAPAYNLLALEWDYRNYTWHTNLDTYDKIVFTDLKSNAVLIASLAYLASEDERFHDRTKIVVPYDTRRNREGKWPEAKDGARSSNN
jgi:hypothetical protein